MILILLKLCPSTFIEPNILQSIAQLLNNFIHFLGLNALSLYENLSILKLIIRCKRSFYDCKVGAIDKRATTFGYGNKINFANNEGVPASGTYDRIS